MSQVCPWCDRSVPSLTYLLDGSKTAVCLECRQVYIRADRSMNPPSGDCWCGQASGTVCFEADLWGYCLTHRTKWVAACGVPFEDDSPEVVRMLDGFNWVGPTIYLDQRADGWDTLPTHGNYYGDCPECGWTSSTLNLGNIHWSYCALHRTKWFLGANLFSNWRREDPDDWQRNAAFLADFSPVEPIYNWVQ